MTDSNTDPYQTGHDVLAVALTLKSERRPFALATVIETEGSTSARTGGKALFDSEGAVIVGWVGGGCAESTVAHTALECLSSGDNQIVALDLDDEVLGVGMPCGGTMRVFVEPFLPKPIVWLLGHGRIAECICDIATMMGFDVVVRDMMATRDRFPSAVKLITEDLPYSDVRLSKTDYLVIATQHKGDHDALRQILVSEAAYVALIASHKRAGLVFDYLRERGVGEEDLGRIRAPGGIEIGASTPEEVALAIVSDIVLHRRRGPGFAISRTNRQSATDR